MQVINSWEELCGLKTDTHCIECADCGAWVLNKDTTKNEIGVDVDYFTSHTFYGGDATTRANELLRKFGFDSIIIKKEDKCG